MRLKINKKKYHNKELKRSKRIRFYEYFFRDLYLGNISWPMTSENIYDNFKSR